MCLADLQAEIRKESSLAEAEAARRNAGGRSPVTFSQALADFRAQGYPGEAAEALAKKRVAQETQEARPRWTTEQVFEERIDAERRRRLDAGTLTRCPACRKFAPLSHGVVLGHLRWNMGDDEGRGSGLVACDGEGQIVTR